MSEDEFYYIMGIQNRLGGREHACSECGQPGYVSPAGEKLLEGKTLVCLKCALEHMVEDEAENIFAPPSPEQAKEVMDYLDPWKNRKEEKEDK